jgi:hypothetical protein
MADKFIAYDSFAKLNIMSEVSGVNDKIIPQIMFNLSNTGTKKTWNGDRLAITYNSGNSASLFRISEVTGSYRNKLNFELLGANNIFYGSVKGTSNNSFIFSQNNTISNSSFDNNFINADGNRIVPTYTSGINFIDSNNNLITSGYLHHRFSSAANISYYHSNNNRMLPQFAFIKGYKGTNGGKDLISQPLYDNNGLITGYSLLSSYNGTDVYIKGVAGGVLRNYTFINSDYNRILGHNNYDSYTTIINSHNGYYLSDNETKNTVLIGNDWGYIKGASGNTIAIGKGLINYNTSSDKIILGQFNRNSQDPNDILIVGDGRLSQEYLDSLTALNKDWATNDKSYANILSALSSNGSPSADSGLYRHNIFTVNKNGYITISDWTNPSNSARYGYNGITAYLDNVSYTIPFRTLYNKINVNDAITQMQETVDSYTQQMDDIIKTMPSNYFYSVKNSTNHIFLNIDNNKSNVGASAWIWKEISAKMENNTILGITYEGIDPSKELTIYWSATNGGNNVVPGGANTATYNNSTVLYTTIKPYCSKQFLYLTSGTNKLGPKDDSVEQQIIGDETSEVQGFMLIQD